jgi:hydrogenase-4 component B
MLWGALQFSALRAWFFLVLGIVSTMSSWYRWGYHESDRRSSIWYPLFLISMATVIASNTVWVFMTAWESMTVTSFFLVTAHREQAGVVRSGYIYLVMSQLSAMLILSGLLAMGAALHSLNFSVWALAAHTLPWGLKTWIFVLLSTGFAIKSGVVPFHVWLPRAHPVAPAPVSSLMSGAMIKLGIFGMIQFVLLDLGPTSSSLALILLAAGAISSLLGILYALMEQDLKRLLAYSSIENIGIIFLGLGILSLGLDTHHPILIAAGLLASLWHTLNHAIIKAQLFLAAGSVQQHTGSLDADQLGGLVRTVPGLAVGFLVGSMAISGLPPLNGFVSEWIALRGLLEMTEVFHGVTALYGLGLAALLGLASALAGVGFVKAFGVIFLGQPRRVLAYQPLPPSLIQPVLTMAFLSFIFGIFPGPIEALMRPIAPSLRARFSIETLLAPTHIALVALLLLALAGGFFALTRPWQAAMVPRWSSGRIPDARMQFTGASFSKAIRTTFSVIYRPHRELTMSGLHAPDFPEQLMYRGGTQPIWERYLYRPLYRLLWQASHLSTRLQSGPVRLYLAYLLGTIGLMLALLH